MRGKQILKKVVNNPYFGVERHGMTWEEQKIWDRRVGMLVGGVLCTGSLGLATYAAIRVINWLMGV